MIKKIVNVLFIDLVKSQKKNFPGTYKMCPKLNWYFKTREFGILERVIQEVTSKEYETALNRKRKTV